MHLIEKSGAAGGIGVADVEDVTVVTMWGEVDAALREQASESMAAALTSPLRVVVDVSDVTFIDSSGLAFVLQLHLAATETGRRVTLHDPHGTVTDLLAMIGMADEIQPEGDPVRA